MGGPSSTHWRDEKCLQSFDWKTEEKTPAGRPRRRWEDNIRLDLRGIGREGVVWIHLPQDRDNKGINIRVL